MAKNRDEFHVVMLPWSAFGHMIPFYQLAISMAKHGVRISYISTARNIERLPEIPSELATLVQYVTLLMPTIPNNRLPQGAEATVDLEFDEIQYLKIAYDLLFQPFKEFVSQHSVDWIITDFASHWMPEIAQEYKVQLMWFSVYTATMISFCGPPEYLSGEGQKKVRPTPDNWTAVPPFWGSTFPTSITLRSYEATKFHVGLFHQNASGITDGERIAKMVQGSDVVAVRTCREFEGEFLDLYQKLINKPVVPVGLLPPQKSETEIRENPWKEIFNWLDEQKPRSVIYVGFGSEYKLTKDEVYEIAYGLELAQLPFLWALRWPTWAVKESEVLPPQFLNRTAGKGIVSLGWAPQMEILGHFSIGGSLFHSGWGSIIETVQNGINMVLLPFIVDQGLNARAMVEKGLGVEVERREDGSFTRSDIADALRRAMVGDQAREISTLVGQAAGVFGDRKLQDGMYVSKFVEFLKSGVDVEK